MKTRFKHLLFLAVLLTALLCLTALAASATCSLNGNSYPTLADAIAASSGTSEFGDTNTITITENETISSELVISKPVKILAEDGVTLTLNNCINPKETVWIEGVDLVAGNIRYAFYCGTATGNLTLKDCNLTDAETYTTGSFTQTFMISKSTVTIDGGEYHAVLGPSGVNNLMFDVQGTGKLYIKGGTFYDAANSRAIIRVPGAFTGTCEISGGTFNISKQNGIWFDNATSGTVSINENDASVSFTRTGSSAAALFDFNTAGTLNIAGGTYTSPKFLFNCRKEGGALNISGGTFTSSGAQVMDITANQTITISGGTLTASANAHAITTSASPTLNLNGGTITTTGSSSYSCISTSGAAAQTPAINIAGATLSATNARGITMSSAGTITMTDGDISVGSFGIWSNNGAGSIKIQGGSISRAGNRAVGTSVGSSIEVSGGTITPSSGAHGIMMEGTAGTITVSGGTITCSGAGDVFYVTVAGVTLNVSGGTMESAKPGTSSAPASAIFCFTKVPTSFTVSGGSFTSTGAFAATYFSDVAGVTLDVSAADPENPPVFRTAYRIFSINKNTTINISGGDFVTSANENMIWQNGGAPVITITGGTFGSDDVANSSCLVGGSYGTVNIQGGVFRSKYSRLIFSEGANLNVTGGEYHNVATGAYGVFDLSGANKTYTANFENITVTGAAGVFMYRTSGTLNIKSGSYTATTGNALKYYNANATGNVTISGGTLQANGGSVVAVLSAATSANLSITGGTLSGARAGTSKAYVSAVFDFAAVPASLSITGGTFTSTGAYAAVYQSSVAGVDFVIEDDGDAETPAPAFTSAWRVFNFSHAGTLTMTAGTMTGADQTICTGAACTFNLNGGTISNSASASCIYDQGASTINLGGVTLSSTNGRGVTMSSAGTLTMTAGTISVGGFGIWNNVNNDTDNETVRATITISGGRIENSNRAVGSSKGAAISLSNCTIVSSANSLFIEGVAPATPVTIYNASLSTDSASNVIYVTKGGTEIEISGTSAISAGTGAAVYMEGAGSTLTISDSATLTSSDYILNLRHATTVTIEDDASLTSTGTSNPVIYTQSGASDVTISGNATLSQTGSKDAIYWSGTGSLIIEGNASVTSANANALTLNADVTVTISDNAAVTGAHNVIEVSSSSTLNLSGGTIETITDDSDYACVYTTGGTAKHPVINLAGAALSATAARGVNMGSAGTVTMTAGSIDVGAFGIWSNNGAGSISVSGGTISGNRGIGTSVGSSITISGDAEINAINQLAVLIQSTAADLTISGTPTLYAESSATICITVGGCNIDISGGTFRSENAGTKVEGAVTYADGIFSMTGGAPASFTISGGTFSAEGAYSCVWFNRNVTGAALTISGSPSFSSTSRTLYLGTTTTLNISGGTFVTTGADHMFWQNGGSTVTTITGGTFGSVDYNAACLVGGSVGTINISGGTFRSGASRLLFSQGANLNVTGGTFTAPASSNDVFDLDANKSYTANFENITVSGVNKIFRFRTAGSLNIKSGTYTSTGDTLEFYNHANTKGTVTLGGTANTLTMRSAGGNGRVIVASGSATGTLVIERNANLISDARVAELSAPITLTINDGYLQSGANASGLAVWNNVAAATITMNGGTITGTASNEENAPLDGTFRGIGTSAGATITVTGGTIHTRGAAIYAEGVNAATITVTGGTFYKTDDTAAENSLFNIKNASTVTITNGTFNSRAQRMLTASGVTTIKGGTFVGTDDVDIFLYPANGTMTILGGYFSSTAYYMVRVGNGTNETTLNVYGGTFVQGTPAEGNAGGLVRVGVADSTNDVANIYGGNYTCTRSSGDNHFFWTANNDDTTVCNLYAFTLNGYGDVLKRGMSDDVTWRFPGVSRHYAYNNIEVETGAAIRLNLDHPGIRFTSTVPAGFIESVNGLKKDGTDIKYGTLIVPLTYYTVDGITLTKEALEAAGKVYLDIPAVAGITVEDDDSLTICASMIDIKKGNYNRTFAAAFYVEYTATDGSTVRYYADFSPENNARSVKDVAQVALNDVRASKVGDYLNRFEGSYSRYSTRQRAVLAAFGATYSPKAVDIYVIAGQSNAAGYSDMTSAFSAAHTESYEHVLYTGIAATGNGYGGFVNKKDLVPVTKGLGANRTGARIGAEFGMAAMLSEYYLGDDYTGTANTVDRDACIVKWADGATNLTDVFGTKNTNGGDFREGSWTPPSYLETYGKNNEYLSGKQYDNLMDVMQNAIKQLREAGYTHISIKGVFWMQGEDDRNVSKVLVNGDEIEIDITDFDSPYAYPALFEALMNDMRAGLGDLTGEDLSEMPFVIGEISDSFGRTHTESQYKFAAMQQEMAERFDNVYTVDCAKLAVGYINSDTAHWTADDMLLIGKMVGTKLLNTVCGQNLAHPALTTSGAADAYVSVTSGGKTTYYNNLPYALNIAPAGSTVTLLKNVTLNSALNIANQNAFTFNGNSKTITSKSVDAALRFIGTDITINNLTVLHAGADTSSNVYFNNAQVTSTNFVWKTTASAAATLTVTKSGGGTAFATNVMTNLAPVVALCPDGGTVTLGDDFNWTSAATVTEKSITINGAGHTVTATVGNALRFYTSGSNTINNLNWVQKATSATAYPILVSGSAQLAVTGNSSFTADTSEYAEGKFYVPVNYAVRYTTSVPTALSNVSFANTVTFTDIGKCNVQFNAANETLNAGIAAAIAGAGEDADAQRTAVASYLNSNATKQTATLAWYKTVSNLTLTGTYDVDHYIWDGDGNLVVEKTITLTNPVYKYTQGGLLIDGYFYLAMQNVSQLEEGTLRSGDHESTILVKFDPSTGKVVAYTAPMDLDHNNSITYNPTTGELLIAHNSPNYDMVSVFNLSDITGTGTVVEREIIKMPYSIYSISYNETRDQYVAYVSGGHSIMILDADFTIVKVIKTLALGTTFTSQQGTIDDDYIYMLWHQNNCIVKYNWNGEIVAYIPLTSYTIYEPENITMTDSTHGYVMMVGSSVTYIYRLTLS